MILNDCDSVCMFYLHNSRPELNVVRTSALHSLVLAGGNDGFVEAFDPRQRASVVRYARALELLIVALLMRVCN